MDQKKERWTELCLAYISRSVAVVSIHKTYNDWKTITDTCSQIIDTSNKVLDSGDLDPDTEQKVYWSLYYALHHLALYRYMKDDYLGALKYLESVDMEVFPLSAPLAAMCCYLHIDPTAEELRDAIMSMTPYMQIFENHKDDIFAENPTAYDQLYISGTYLCLSFRYRFGFGVPKNLETARSCLEDGIERLDDNDATELLYTELSHYRIGLFGGIKYV